MWVQSRGSYQEPVSLIEFTSRIHAGHWCTIFPRTVLLLRFSMQPTCRFVCLSANRCVPLPWSFDSLHLLPSLIAASDSLDLCQLCWLRWAFSTGFLVMFVYHFGRVGVYLPLTFVFHLSLVVFVANDNNVMLYVAHSVWGLHLFFLSFAGSWVLGPYGCSVQCLGKRLGDQFPLATIDMGLFPQNRMVSKQTQAFRKKG